MPTISVFLFQANRTYSTLTWSWMQLSLHYCLSINQWRVHEAKYLPLTKVTQLQSHRISQWPSYLKVPVFAELGMCDIILNQLLPSKYCLLSDHTNVTCDLQLMSPVQKFRYIHHSQVISYTFLVADCQSSTAALS